MRPQFFQGRTNIWYKYIFLWTDVDKTSISPSQKAMYSLHTKYSPLKRVLPLPISLLKFENIFLDYTQVRVQICEKALRKENN